MCSSAAGVAPLQELLEAQEVGTTCSISCLRDILLRSRPLAISMPRRRRRRVAVGGGRHEFLRHGAALRRQARPTLISPQLSAARASLSTACAGELLVGVERAAGRRRRAPRGRSAVTSMRCSSVSAESTNRTTSRRLPRSWPASSPWRAAGGRPACQRPPESASTCFSSGARSERSTPLKSTALAAVPSPPWRRMPGTWGAPRAVEDAGVPTRAGPAAS